MTSVIGYAANGHVWIAGDSCVGNDNDQFVTLNKKVFRVGELLIGCSGSLRRWQLLQYELALSPDDDGGDPERYIVTVVVEAIRRLFADRAAAIIEDGMEYGGTFIIGYRGHLYEMDNNYQVLERTSQTAAIGTGGPYALGAFHGMIDTIPGVNIPLLLTRALEISARFASCVAPPFVVESV